MVVPVILLWQCPGGDLDDKQIPIGIGEPLCCGLALGGGHESEHLNEIACLQGAEVSFFEFGTTIEGHFGEGAIVLLEVLLVVEPDGVVRLVEGQDAGLELFCCFEGS
jgi:hypothetical protein